MNPSYTLGNKGIKAEDGQVKKRESWYSYST